MDHAGYIRVRNWDKYQHYTSRTPPWIKLHNTLLDDYEYTSLPDSSKSHLLGIFMLASRLDNKLPNDGRWIANRIGATSAVKLDVLTHFLAPLPNGKHDASAALAEGTHSRARARSVSVSVSGCLSKKDAAEFDRFWKHYPKRMGKRDAQKAWQQTASDRPPIDVLIVKVDELATSREWMKEKDEEVYKRLTEKNNQKVKGGSAS